METALAKEVHLVPESVVRLEIDHALVHSLVKMKLGLSETTSAQSRDHVRDDYLAQNTWVRMGHFVFVICK